uniref:Uncharacterized protein n=1 Tax=Rhizophora mucronata TaxID=61149 RepID=A0A2P2NQC1_RHIMU
MYASFPLRNMKTRNSTKPMPNDVATIMMIENFASFGLPLPSSFDTLTLAAAKKPRDIIISHPLMLMQIARASMAISAFFKFPVKRTKMVLYQSSRQSIAPEDKESLITGQRSLTASIEKPFQVSRHPPHVTNES